jgi:hypothetical protein
MTASFIENEENEDFAERRTFPRILASCPVLYRLASTDRWQVAKMVDYSATGMRLGCDENLPVDTEIAIQVKPGSIKTIPKLSVEGLVVHSDLNKDEHFTVSVKVLKVLRDP